MEINRYPGLSPKGLRISPKQICVRLNHKLPVYNLKSNCIMWHHREETDIQQTDKIFCHWCLATTWKYSLKYIWEYSVGLLMIGYVMRPDPKSFYCWTAWLAQDRMRGPKKRKAIFSLSLQSPSGCMRNPVRRPRPNLTRFEPYKIMFTEKKAENILAPTLSLCPAGVYSRIKQL